jgi:hypothetical protein
MNEKQKLLQRKKRAEEGLEIIRQTLVDLTEILTDRPRKSSYTLSELSYELQGIENKILFSEEYKNIKVLIPDPSGQFDNIVLTDVSVEITDNNEKVVVLS